MREEPVMDDGQCGVLKKDRGRFDASTEDWLEHDRGPQQE